MELLEKLKHLELNVKTLAEIKETLTLEEIEQNKRYEWEVRYGLFESIQIVIDISCKIVSTYNLGNPKEYKECIKLLHQHNYLTKALSSKVISMVGLRNLLVHEYVQIENKKLYEYLDFLEDFISFAHEITKQLR